MVDISASSRTYLGPEQSGAVTSHSIDDTARKVTQLFEARGFAMIDQHRDGPDGARARAGACSERPAWTYSRCDVTIIDT